VCDKEWRSSQRIQEARKNRSQVSNLYVSYISFKLEYQFIVEQYCLKLSGFNFPHNSVSFSYEKLIFKCQVTFGSTKKYEVYGGRELLLLLYLFHKNLFFLFERGKQVKQTFNAIFCFISVFFRTYLYKELYISEVFFCLPILNFK
jgi:hypothetical protein